VTAGFAPRGLLTSVGISVLNALSGPRGPDRFLELLNPSWSVRETRGEVVRVCRPAPGSLTLLVRPNWRWAGFRAGQHVQLGVDIEGVNCRRCYSIVSSEHDRTGLLEFTVKAELGGQVSTHLHRHAQPGTVLRLSAAQGPFSLPEPRPDRLMLISGGSGITPAMSMLRTLCDEGRADTVTFLHYARSAEHVAYRDELAEISTAHRGLRLLRSYTRGTSGELTGRFRAAHLAGLDDQPAWVCGPASLVEAVREQWRGRDAALHVEHFTPPPAPPVAVDSDPSGSVSFATSGRRVRNSGATLLEQAEAAGLRPEFGCRMGICFSCTRRKTEGTVRHLRNGTVSAGPDDIQLCVTTPCGDVSIDL
jgi:ferredoxin-NADP reductase